MSINTVISLFVYLILINAYANDSYDPKSFYQTYLEGLKAAKDGRLRYHDCDCYIAIPSPDEPLGKKEGSCTYMQGPGDTNFILTVDHMRPNDKKGPVMDFSKNEGAIVCFDEKNSFSAERNCYSLIRMVSLKDLSENDILFRNIKVQDLDLAIAYLSEEPNILPAVFGEYSSLEAESYTAGGYSYPMAQSSWYKDIHQKSHMPPQKCIKKVHLKPESKHAEYDVTYLESDYDPRINPNHRKDLPLASGESGASLRNKDGEVIGVHGGTFYARFFLDELRMCDYFIPTPKLKTDIWRAVQRYVPPNDSQKALACIE